MTSPFRSRTTSPSWPHAAPTASLHSSLEEYNNGQDLRSFYLTNETYPIQGINATQSETSQINVLADGGGEGGVIVESADALLQGLYPPYNDSITLANGTVVTWPASRAQLIPMEEIVPDYEYWMEGYSDCNTWSNQLAQWYDSPEFKSNATIANAFYQNISSILGDRPLTLQNGYNIFDFMNVEYIHNATLSPLIAPYLAEAKYWGDYHESGSFSAADPTAIQNVAAQSFLPPLLDGVNQIANTSESGLKIQFLAVSYKPFLGLFGMMGLDAPFTNSLVNYASVATFEVWSDDSIVFRFRNGSQGAFEQYPIFGQEGGTTSRTTFVDALQPYSIDSRADWCNVCSNTEDYGCDVLAAYNGTGGGAVKYSSATSTTGRHHVSPVVAGVIGALVALAVAACLLAGWLFFGGLVSRQNRRRSNRAPASSINNNHKTNGAYAAADTPSGSGYELGTQPGSPDEADDATASAAGSVNKGSETGHSR